MAENEDVNLGRLLGELSDSVESKLGDILELNHDIVAATRKMAHNLLVIRKAHLEEADRIMEVVAVLAESLQVTTELAADMLATEFGDGPFEVGETGDEEPGDE